uniref:Uncharacterized protein n=1 Tax=Sipha flava TaxID=143950 RepID=A0A2S2Q8V4_9HEMI
MLRLFLYTYQIAKLLRAYLKETKKYRVLNIVHRSMLNYSNALDEHLPPSERASLMVAEEKPLPDSSPVQHSPTDPEVCAVCVNTGSSLMMTSPNVTRRSSHTLSNHVCQMD